jgi:hypothetical protein
MTGAVIGCLSHDTGPEPPEIVGTRTFGGAKLTHRGMHILTGGELVFNARNIVKCDPKKRVFDI